MLSQPTSIELFAGGGGMALGMRLGGFRHLALVEWNKNAALVLRHNAEARPALWKAEEVFEEDVRVWLKSTAVTGEVDLVAGGPPCQPFSLGGVHAGDDDSRNMFPASLDVIRRTRPKIAVFENVPGLTRPSFSPYFQYIKDQLSKPSVAPRTDELWTDHHLRVLQSTSSLRYLVHEHRIDAADLGLPQNRRRVFLIAIRADVHGSESWEGPVMTHSRDALLHDQWITGDYWAEHDQRQPELPADVSRQVSRIRDSGKPDNLRWRTIRDGIRGMPEPIDGQDSHSFANHRGIPGARSYPKHSGSAFDWPAKTIKAGVHGVSGGEAMIRFADGRLRYLTVRESARMQGFTDDYEFPGSRSRTMAAIGNAVAVPVAENLARLLIEHCQLQPVGRDGVDTTLGDGDSGSGLRYVSESLAIESRYEKELAAAMA